jgi:hypothetical protein
VLKCLLSDTKFVNTCSFTLHFKKMSMYSKVFVEGIICFGELVEAAYSSFHSASLTLEASPNTKETKESLL